MSYINDAFDFLVDVLFGLAILLFLARFLLQWVKADFYNPISQAVYNLTEPALRPLRRIVPGIYGLDLACVVAMGALQFIALALILYEGSPSIAGLATLTVSELLGLVLKFFIVTIIVQAVASWVSPGGYNPALNVLHRLNEPLLEPARRLIPSMGGLDISPIAVIVALNLLMILFVAPIRNVGLTLM